MASLSLLAHPSLSVSVTFFVRALFRDTVPVPALLYTLLVSVLLPPLCQSGRTCERGRRGKITDCRDAAAVRDRGGFGFGQRLQPTSPQATTIARAVFRCAEEYRIFIT